VQLKRTLAKLVRLTGITRSRQISGIAGVYFVAARASWW